MQKSTITQASPLIRAAEDFLERAKAAEAVHAETLDQMNEQLRETVQERDTKFAMARAKMQEAGEIAAQAIRDMETADAQFVSDMTEFYAAVDKLRASRIQGAKPKLVVATAKE